MGLGNRQTTTEFLGTSLSIVNGHFRKRVPEGTEGAESRKLSKGKNEGSLVWEMKYKNLDGYIIGGNLDTTSQFKSCIIKMEDEGEQFEISLPLDSGYLSEFIQHLPNIDTTLKVDLQIQPKKNRPDSYRLHVLQGKHIDNYYVKWSKDQEGKAVATHLHGMPEWEKDELTGEYDSSKQRRFLLKKFKEYFEAFEPSSVFNSEPSAPPSESVLDAPVAPPPPVVDDEYEDDFPF